MNDPRWVSKQAVLLLHAESLAEHGGLEGVRDEGALESALARPLNLYTYGGVSDLSALATGYAVGISQNHPFIDGNKRAAFIAMGLFLALNGLRLVAPQIEATRVMLAVAAGDLAEPDFTEWLQTYVQPR